MNILGTPEEVRERHGVTVDPSVSNNVTVVETDDHVRLSIYDGVGTKALTLTPDEARHIASKLRRIAWRVEARQ